MVAILFSASARVYNLRILLLAFVVDAALGALFGSSFYRDILIGSNAIFAVHHVVAWSTPGLAVLDLFTVFLEICVIKTKENLHHQRLAFLGCCARSYPGYTPASILFNRSLARPLVRGESKIIIFARAIVISCIGIGVPAFGVYSIFIVPLLIRPVVYTKSLVLSSNTYQAPLKPLTGNATVFLYYSTPKTSIVYLTLARQSVCHLHTCDYYHSGLPISLGPVGWSDIHSMSISVAIPQEIAGVYVYVSDWYSAHTGDGQFESYAIPLGISSAGEQAYTTMDNAYIRIPTPLLPGSHLFGLITWTARQMLNLKLGAADSPGNTLWMYRPEITGLQQNLTIQPLTGSGIATLTLLKPFAEATDYQQDTTDVSLLSGISNLGGFWTFVNGAFTLLFGANVIYFGFGRRPLSALGVVHLFQRRSLVRQWHEDFPALHTEGGLPGSKSSGIVAFIRERLVDLGEGPQNGHDDPLADDIEAQPLHHWHPTSHPSDSELLARNNQESHEGSAESLPVTYLSKNAAAGYILEEMPL
ncbi:hypothetical protein GGX14DRAFT_663886, partial [Mycena pura]